MSPAFHEVYWGILLVFLRIPGASSLKDRRQVVRSLVERLKKKWNVTVTDLGPKDSWTDAGIAVGTLGSSYDSVFLRLEEVGNFVQRREDDSDFYIVSVQREVDRYDTFSD
ncbi:MAG: DUF503 domain-containing protein [Thermovirgaceae bacterium]